MRTKGSKSRSAEQMKQAVMQTIIENRNCDIASIMLHARINQIVAKRILASLLATGIIKSMQACEAGIKDARVSAVYAAENIIIV